MRHWFCMALAALTCLAGFYNPAQAQSPANFALIIANKTYAPRVGPLTNPHKDAEVIGKALVAAGFPPDNIEIVRDANRLQILAAVRRHAQRLAEAGNNAVGFFYYSGHGAAKPDTDRNFIIPVSVADAASPTLWDEAVRLQSVRDILQDYAPGAAHIVVFDACRNELQIPQKGGDKGFLPVSNWGGMLIAYSTSPGRTASDGERGAPAGPYALVLAEELRAANKRSVADIFSDVRIKLRARMRGQEPWYLNGLNSKVVLNASGTGIAVSSGLLSPDNSPEAICKTLPARLSRSIPLKEGDTLCDARGSNSVRVTRIDDQVIQFLVNDAVTYPCPEGKVCVFDWPDAPRFRITARADRARGIKPAGAILPR